MRILSGALYTHAGIEPLAIHAAATTHSRSAGTCHPAVRTRRGAQTAKASSKERRRSKDELVSVRRRSGLLERHNSTRIASGAPRNRAASTLNRKDYRTKERRARVLRGSARTTVLAGKRPGRGGGGGGGGGASEQLAQAAQRRLRDRRWPSPIAELGPRRRRRYGCALAPPVVPDWL